MQSWRDFFQKHENDPKIYGMRAIGKNDKFYQFNIIIIITDHICI